MRDDLDLKERTLNFARQIIRFYSALPKTADAQIIGKQMLRSGTSIGANYREAYRARSKVEFIAKMGDCLKELDETYYWLELLKTEKYITPEKLEATRDETNQLIAIFETIIKNTKANLNS